VKLLIFQLSQFVLELVLLLNEESVKWLAVFEWEEELSSYLVHVYSEIMRGRNRLRNLVRDIHLIPDCIHLRINILDIAIDARRRCFSSRTDRE
jgi:hypothetical protein